VVLDSEVVGIASLKLHGPSTAEIAYDLHARLADDRVPASAASKDHGAAPGTAYALIGPCRRQPTRSSHVSGGAAGSGS